MNQLFFLVFFLSRKLHLYLVSLLFVYRAIPEKIQTGRLRIWKFQRYQRNSMWNFQGLIENEVEFWSVTKKNNVEFLGFFVFGYGISNFCGISRGGALFCLEFPAVK